MHRWGLVLAVALSGCVTEEEYKAIIEDRESLRTRVSELEDELDQAKGKIKEMEKRLEKAAEKVPNRPPEAQVAAAYSQLKLGKKDKIYAELTTTMGPISCELYPHIAPTAVLNFVGLAEGTKEWTDPKTGEKTDMKLYDGTIFHRVIKGFMIQGGDPAGNGHGTPGYTFPDEVWPDIRFDRPGVLAMANGGRNTNGSQFFITEEKQRHLNGKHTIFGLCDMETVKKIIDVEVDEDSKPKTDVVLEKVEIVRKKRD